jgi:hypothetical protein
MTTSNVTPCHHHRVPSVFVNCRSVHLYSEREVQMAYNHYVEEETRKNLRTNLLKDSVFFHENPCRQLPYFLPQGTLLKLSTRYDVSTEVYMDSK